MKANIKKHFWLIVCLVGFFSCGTISDFDIIGCYQMPTKADLALYEYDILVLHDNHTYSKFEAEKNTCNKYKSFYWPYQGTWTKKNNFVYFKSYVQNDTKGWVVESRNPNTDSNNLRIIFRNFIDGKIDTVINYFYIKSKKIEYNENYLPDEYNVKEGICSIKRKTDKLLISKFDTLIISNFDYYDTKFKIQDTLCNQLDIYMIPKAVYDVNTKLKFQKGKLNRYINTFPFNLVYSYIKIEQ